MVDATRKLLDELMGRNRNGDNVRERHYSDDDVCKPFLLGCCPHALWQHTKSDCGPCPYPTCQNDRLKQRFEDDKSLSKQRFERRWRLDLRDSLGRIVAECDRGIERASSELKKRQAVDVAAFEQIPEVKDLRCQLQKLTDDAEVAGEAGDVDKSLDLTKQAEALKRRVVELQSKHLTSADQDLSVCLVTGAYVSTRDPQDHRDTFESGRQYVGWAAVRRKLKELDDLLDSGTAAKKDLMHNGDHCVPGGGQRTQGDASGKKQPTDSSDSSGRKRSCDRARRHRKKRKRSRGKAPAKKKRRRSSSSSSDSSESEEISEHERTRLRRDR